MSLTIEELRDKFPFLICGTYLEQEYLGICQNSDSHIISIYLYTHIPDEKLKKEFLLCGENWWWESNRQIPISVFLKDRFKVFRPFMKSFIRKDFNILWGPTVSLQENMSRKVKRRQISLVRNLDSNED